MTDYQALIIYGVKVPRSRVEPRVLGEHLHPIPQGAKFCPECGQKIELKRTHPFENHGLLSVFTANDINPQDTDWAILGRQIACAADPNGEITDVLFGESTVVEDTLYQLGFSEPCRFYLILRLD